MNASEHRLRAELRAESELIMHGSLRELDFRPVDDRVSSDRRRLRMVWVAPIAAAASVAVIFALTAVISHHGLSAGPQPGGSGTPTAGQVTGITAISARDAWAVGYLKIGRTRYSNETDEPLIEHWNGVSWRRVAAPTEPGGLQLSSIAGTSSDSLWAVGYGITNKPVIMHWNGHTWRLQRFAAANRVGILNAVAVTSPTDAWAVGQTGGRVPGAFILHWNGHAWIKEQPPAATGDRFLMSVTAISASNAWAVGSTQNDLYILHWNGSSWTQVPGPQHHAAQPVLEAVAAGSDGTVWAAGLTDGQPATTVLLRWTGTAWQQVDRGKRGLGDAIYAMTVISPSNVWAAGGGASSRSTVILHWNGTTWTRITTPGTTFPGRITDLAATSASDVWAVGYRGDYGSAGVPQILHWNGSKWTRSFGPYSTGGLYENSSCGPYRTCSQGR